MDGFDKWKRDTKENFLIYWITHKETWIHFAICVGFSISFSVLIFMESGVESELTFQLISAFVRMGVFLFLVLSYLTVLENRRRGERRNMFIEDIKNGKLVSARKATRKYYPILEDCLDPKDEIRVCTDIGEEVVKFKDLPDRTARIPGPIEFFKNMISKKMNKKDFLEKVSNKDDTPLFALTDKEREIFDSLKEDGKVSVDDRTKIIELTEDGKEELRDMKKSTRGGGVSIHTGKYSKGREVQVKKEAEELLDQITENVSAEPGALSSIKEVASLSFMYAENSDSVEESIKLYETVKNLSKLARKVSEQR